MGLRCYLRTNETAVGGTREKQRACEASKLSHCDARAHRKKDRERERERGRKNVFQQLWCGLHCIFVTGLCGQLGGWGFTWVRSQNGFKSTPSQCRPPAREGGERRRGGDLPSSPTTPCLKVLCVNQYAARVTCKRVFPQELPNSLSFSLFPYPHTDAITRSAN